LVYSVLFDEAGKPQQVDLLYPGVLNPDIKRLDAVTREVMRQWKVAYSFDGVPITCRAMVPITFQTDFQTGALQAPAEVGAQFDSYPDKCPAVTLETQVVGSFL
jgi:hypothetical protein